MHNINMKFRKDGVKLVKRNRLRRLDEALAVYGALATRI
jgi:hypothetical protein